jgi:hypothetical protein
VSETTTACPECDSSQVYERQTVSPAWRCNDCGAEFETPVERECYEDITPDRPDLDDHDEESPDGPTAAPLDTPDAVFADVGPGETLRIDNYADAFTLMEVRDRTVWDVPFGEDWVDAEVILTRGAGLSGTAYRVVVTSDGTVESFRPRGDSHVSEADTRVGAFDDVAVDGEISTAAKLQLIGRNAETNEKPAGDDSWQQYYREADS